jgi:hypothetical protein
MSLSTTVMSAVDPRAVGALLRCRDHRDGNNAEDGGGVVW